MGKIGKISAIKKEYNSSLMQTMQSGLANKGLSRAPGTGATKLPYKELDGKYRTGLDPDAKYIARIQDPQERELEKKRVKELRDKLQAVTGLELGPNSKYWNYALASDPHNDPTHVQPIKLVDGDNLFDLSSPLQELAFSWLRVHPTVASSFHAWEKGEYPADVQWYVSDDEVDNKRTYAKKQLINKAIVKFDDMAPSKRRQVARLMGLPVTEDSKDEMVYNQVDNLFKQSEFKGGIYHGLSPVEVFNRFATMKEDLLAVKDLVKQALAHSVYRDRGGRIFEGEREIGKSEDAVVEFLINEDHQDELLVLQGKLRSKKIAAT